MGGVVSSIMVLPVLAALVTVVTSFLWFVGAFRTILFRRTEIGPMTLVCQRGQGPYEQVGPLFDRVASLLREYSLKNVFRTAGIYYDDPKTTKTPRYAVGFLVEPHNRQHFDKSILFDQINKTKEWEVWDIGLTTTAVSVFPIRNQSLQIIGIALSAMKTYAAFQKQTEFKLECGSLEIYTDHTVETHFPQSNMKQFLPRQ